MAAHDAGVNVDVFNLIPTAFLQPPLEDAPLIRGQHNLIGCVVDATMICPRSTRNNKMFFLCQCLANTIE